MMRIRELIYWLLFALCVYPMYGENSVSQYLSVTDLFRLAEQTYTAKGDRILEMSAREQLKSAESELLPEIRMDAEAGYWGQSIYLGGPHWQQTYGIQLSQPIYQGGRIKQNINLASTKQKIAQLQSIANESDLRLELLGYYCTLLNLWEQKKVRKNNIEESQRRYLDVGNMFENGVVTRNDVIRSSLQLSQDSLVYRTIENDISIASYRLATIIGLDTSELIMPDTTLFQHPQDANMLQPMIYYLELAHGKCPDLLVAEQEVRKAETVLKLTKSQNLPSLNFIAGYALGRPYKLAFENKYFNNWNIGLNLSYTLSSLYHNRHTLRAKEQDISFYQNERLKLIQDVDINVNKCYVKYTESWDNINALQHSVAQAKENYRIVRNRYRNQLSILTDLLDANNVLLEAELKLTVARVDCIYSFFTLMHACGNL